MAPATKTCPAGGALGAHRRDSSNFGAMLRGGAPRRGRAAEPRGDAHGPWGRLPVDRNKQKTDMGGLRKTGPIVFDANFLTASRDMEASDATKKTGTFLSRFCAKNFRTWRAPRHVGERHCATTGGP